MKLGRGQIAKSTVYPDLKSIRPLKVTPSEHWTGVTETEARGVREIFNRFDVEDRIVVMTEENFCDMFGTVNPYFYLKWQEEGVEAAFDWLLNNEEKE